MSDMEEVTAEIADLLARREALRESLAEVNSQRELFAEAVQKARAALAEASASLAAVDAEIAEARVPIVTEIEDIRSALRAASTRRQALVLAEAVPPPDDPGAVLSAPAIESEEALGAI